MGIIKELLDDLESYNATPEGRAFGLRMDLAGIIGMGLNRLSWEVKDLASESGISVGRLADMLMADSNPRLNDVARICEALGVEATLAAEPIVAKPEDD
jgi:hypothetical protein